MNTPKRPDERVGLGAGVAYDPVKPLFNALRIRRRLTHLRTERFPIREDAVVVLEDLLGANVTHSERDYDGEVDLICEPGGGTIAYLNTDAHGGNGYLSVAASTRAYAGATLDRLVAALRRDDTDDDRVAMRLWTKGAGSPTFTRRVLDAPSIIDAATNYPRAVRGELERMCGIDQDAVGGLALWYGPPGTGKTTAVRALARAWRAWCDVHVVVDPESLLADPGYLMKVVTERSFEDDLPAGAVSAERRSRLVVLEDAGELLSADARARTGQGLSRILNVTDGLVGRGLGTSILITTNEEVGSLHPAIRRPGRCWAQVRFGRFSGPEARAWLDRRGIERGSVAGSRSLAELFAIERGDLIDDPADRSPLGFRA